MLHDPRYPTAESLLALVKQGLPVYGMAGVGAGKDSEGSNWIVRTLERPDDRPLWIAVWGGANTLAQALYTIRATRSTEDTARLLAKLRVYTISDQDDSGAWIRRTFPDLFYIVSPGGYGEATWTAINSVIPNIDNSTISNRWLADRIQQGHGPLGAVYPDVAYGMDGDTPDAAVVRTGETAVSTTDPRPGDGGRTDPATAPFTSVEYVGLYYGDGWRSRRAPAAPSRARRTGASTPRGVTFQPGVSRGDASRVIDDAASASGWSRRS